MTSAFFEVINHMNSSTEKTASYKSNLAFLSAMTFIFGFACLLCGYLALPVAAGFYAALLTIEKKDARVLSYLIPLLLLVINIFLNGFCSLEAVSYVVIGAILFVGYDRRKSKAATVSIATLVLVFLMLLSLVLFAFDKVGTFKNFAINEYFIDLYESGKTKFVEVATSLKSVDAEGVTFHNINAGDAVDIYNSAVFYHIPLIAIFAFVLVGIASKIQFSRIRKDENHKERILSWRFITTPFIAYSYLVITILTSLNSQGIIGVSLLFVSLILMAVYFYIGVTFIFKFLSLKKSRGFAILIIILSIGIFFSYALQLISFIGIFVNNRVYKNINSSDVDVL